MNDLTTKSSRSFSETLSWIIVVISFCFMMGIFTFTPLLLRSKNGEVAHQAGQLYALANNKKQAIIWLKKAVDEGNADAANDLGVLYSDGDGVEKNIKEAMTLYKIAADRGDHFGMYNLGLNYSHLNHQTDQIPSQNELKQAVFWYKKSMEKGDYCASNDLAILYATGLGVDQNTSKSKDYFYKSGYMFLLNILNSISVDPHLNRKAGYRSSNDVLAKFGLLKLYAEYQFSQANHSNNSAIFKNTSPEAMKTLKDLSAQIINDCWK